MKYFLFRIGLFTALLFLVTNCSSTKSINTNVPLVKTETTIQELDSVSYIKTERKNFFPETEAETVWVDSIYNQMTFEEKVGQLFMVAAYSNKDAAHVAEIEKLVCDYKIGGLIFFQGGRRVV